MPVIDSREVTKAVVVSIVISPNKVKKEIIDGKEVITYFTTMNVRYSLQDANMHLEYKNVPHTSTHTSKPLDETELFAFIGSGRPDIKADILLLSNVDIDE